jgi:hypothetical protein
LLLAPLEVFTKRRREPLVPRGQLLRLAGLRHINPFKACRVPRCNRPFEPRALRQNGRYGKDRRASSADFERRLLP